MRKTEADEAALRTEPGEVKAWYTPVGARPSLGRVVACVWTAEPSGEHLLVPDGCMDLLWFQRPSQLPSDRQTAPSDTLWLCGPETTAWRFALPPGTAAVGVRFRPGYGSVVLGMPAATVTNRRVLLRDLASVTNAASLATSLAEAAASGSFVSARDTLESFVAERIEANPRLGSDAFVDAVIEHVAGSRLPSQASLANALGMTPRHLHRRMLERFGYGVAQLARLLRFQRFLAQFDLDQQSVSPPRVSLGTLAGTAGYADQAHLARDCRAITGMAPRRFLDGYFPTFPDMSDPFKTMRSFAVNMAE